MKKLRAFLKDSAEEVLTKVSWPKYSELQSSSTLVLVATVIFALLVFVVDYGFRNATTWFYQSF